MKKLITLLSFVLIVNMLTAQVSKSRFENPIERAKAQDALRHKDVASAKLPFFNALKIPIVTKKAVKSLQTTFYKSVTITAGGLYSALNYSELHTVTNLSISGTIDARDFKTMRDSMTVLSVIDISNTTIAAFSGSGGTSSSPYNANEIPAYAFFINSNQGGSYNTTLTSIQLPSSITSIGSTAFALCSALNSINIPSSVQTLGQTVFTGSNCYITVDANNTKFASMDGVLFDKNMTTLIQCPTSKNGSYIIPSTVRSIGLGAFYACNTLTSVNIPSSVNTIGDMAFYNCTGLTSITVNSSPISLTSSSSSNPVFMLVNFATCTLYVPYGAKTLYQAADQWSSFTNIVESSQGFLVGSNSAKLTAAANSTATINVKANVSWSANSDQSWLSISPSGGYGDGILTLTAQANTADVSRTAIITVSSFSGYASQTISVTQGVFAKTYTVTAGGLSSILTPTGLSTYSNLKLTGTLDARDFKVMRDSMPLLSDLDLSGVTIAAYSGTNGTSSYNSDYPANEIPTYAFLNSYYYIGKISLTTLILPSSVTSIGSSAFNSCTGLISITIPTSVTSIGSSAFERCSRLKNITLPVSLTTIGSYAFEYCSGLTSVTIPASVTTIGNNAFSYCSKLTSITVQSGNLNYSSLDGVLFDKSQSTIIQYPTGKVGNYIIPATVTTIASSTFESCLGLTSITIPAGVTTIEGYALGGCSKLTTITVESGNLNYSSLDGVLFNKNQTTLIQCPGAKTGSYIIPATVTSIGSSAFTSCSGLTSITIPSSVTAIGSYAFQSCSGLTSLYVNSNPIDLNNVWSVFSGINTSTCTLYVPYGSKALYQSANQWGNFKNIVENSQGFLLGSNTANLDAKAGSNANIIISANVSWTASSNQSWLTVSPGWGYGNGTLTLTATANSSVSNRSATITVSAAGVTSQTITVNQYGAPKILTVTAGGLLSSLTSTEKKTITSLQLSGTIDARDFKTMRDSLPLLANIDLSAVNIVAYAGSDGTSTYTTQYLANVIPEYAFFISSTWSGKSTLTSIVLPNSATSIGNYAFNSCSGLISFSIGNSLTAIDNNVFYGCNALTTVVVQPSNPNYVSINGVLFNKNQTTLVLYPVGKQETTYTIPTTVTSIVDNAFSNAKINNITIPNSVLSIGNYAFSGCNSLSSITLGSAVTTIGQRAFQGSGLKSIDIPTSVNSIGTGAFTYCLNLTQFTVQPANTYLSTTDGVLFNKSQTTLIQNVLNNKSAYSIPTTVTAIADNAFEINNLIRINIPKSVTSIGNYAFQYCNYLDSVFVYASTPIDLSTKTNVFSSIKSTCSLFVPTGSKNLYAAAAQWNSIVNIIEVAPVSQTLNITTPGSLSTVLTPDQLNTISKLTITGTIDARDFKTMRDLMPLLANLDLNGVSIVAYTGTAGTYSNTTSSIIYPANEIPSDAFYNPSNGIGKVGLTTVTLPLNATSIGSYAFERCSGLTSITIPSSVTNIGTYAFYYCSKLTSVSLPDALTTIGNNAFYGCSVLTSIIIPSSVAYIGSLAFSYCNLLTSISVQSGNANFSSVDGVLFNKNQTTLIQCPGAKTGTYVIPATVTVIGDYAFNYCSLLTTVTIPGSATAIGNSAFYSCSTLTGITIPTAVTTIGNNAFAYCSAITSISIPASVTAIGLGVFNYCTKLTGITVESSNLNYSAVSGVLFDKNQTVLIQYPNGKVGNSYAIPATVNSIGDYAFYNCSALTSITIPNLLTKIGNNAFYRCIGLTSITIPASVTSIGSFAFYYCNKLTSINIPTSVTYIGTYAFAYLSGLTSIYVNSKPITLTSSSVFSGVNTSTCILNVPYNTKTLYAAATYWNSFVNILEATSGFLLDVNSLNMPASAGSSTVSIAANMTWATSSDKTWLTVSPSSGSGNNILVLNVQANTTELSRTATVTVSATGITSQIITVTQVGQPKSIYVTPGSLATILTTDQLNGISDLTITGAIDARDFKTIRDKMPLLAKLNLSGVNIVEYTGLEGTAGVSTILYPQNTIPDYAFCLPVTYVGKTSLKNIVFPSSLIAIGNTTFENCTGLSGELTIPASVTSIGIYAFYGCTGFTGSLNIPSMVNTIGMYAFAYCSGFSGTLNLPAMLTSISNCAFFSCTGLTGSLIIPSSITSIGESAFGICSGLSSASIPWSVSSIGMYAFRRTSISFSVDYGNQNYSSSDGILFDKNQTILMQYPISKTGAYVIPTSVNSIGSAAFDYCIGLTSVSIPATVSSIGASAFYYCSGLTSLYSYATTPVDLGINSYVFSGANTGTCTLYVPIGSKSLYQTAVQWKDFINIVEFTTAVKNVLDGGSFHIYPNPVMDAFKIDGFEGSAKLTLLDLNGRLLLQQQLNTNEIVNISSLTKGMYIVKLITESGTFEQKMLKK